MGRLVLTGGVLVDPGRGLDGPATVVVEADRVAAIIPGNGLRTTPDDTILDLGGAWLCPGFVDLRATLAEPGFEHREDLATGLAAAAAGGFTAVACQPTTHPALDNEAVVSHLLGRAAQVGGARLLPVGAATQRLENEALAPYGELRDAGCVAVSQGERPVTTAGLMRHVLEYASIFDLPVISAALDPTLAGVCQEGVWSTRLGLPPSPAAAEVVAVARDIALAELVGARLHLSRISTRAALELVARAKDRGLPVTCDVTPHHLLWTVERLAGYDPAFKVAPPLRDEADVAALREGIRSGVVDAIATDHQPAHAEEKAQEFDRAATGVAGLETALSMVLALWRQGVIDRRTLVARLSLGPQRVLGHAGGALEPGAPADLVAIDPELSWIVEPRALRSRAGNVPCQGEVLRGRAVRTWVAGREVFRWGGEP
jgi:dihydroorotase